MLVWSEAEISVASLCITARFIVVPSAIYATGPRRAGEEPNCMSFLIAVHTEPISNQAFEGKCLASTDIARPAAGLATWKMSRYGV